MEILQMSLTSGDIWSLLLTTVLVALALLVEHFLTEHWPKQLNYAIGLVTDMGSFLIWAWLRSVHMTWDVAMVMMIAAAAAGIPDFYILWQEKKRHDQAWESLIRMNADYAAALALLERMQGHEWRRLRDIGETMSFALGAAEREMEMLNLFRQQAEPVFQPILDAIKHVEASMGRNGR